MRSALDVWATTSSYAGRRRGLFPRGIDHRYGALSGLLAAYDSLFALSHFFDLAPNDRRAFAVALEKGDQKVAWRFMQRSRGNSKVTIGKVRQTLMKMIAGAHVPATKVGDAAAKD